MSPGLNREGINLPFLRERNRIASLSHREFPGCDKFMKMTRLLLVFACVASKPPAGILFFRKALVSLVFSIGLVASLARGVAAPVVTLGATNIGSREATLNGSVTLNNGGATCHFEFRPSSWSNSVPPSYYKVSAATNIPTGTGTFSWSIHVTNLLPGNRYFYLASSSGSKGVEQTFVTPQADAVTNDVNGIGGYFFGGVGFSFVPTTDIAVSRLAYTAWQDAAAPFVTIRTPSSNVVFGYMPLGIPGDVTYLTNQEVHLRPGQKYSIMVWDAPLGNSLTVFDAATNFAVAPELSSFTSQLIHPDGTIEDFDPRFMFLGANFSFRGLSSPPPRNWGLHQINNQRKLRLWWPAPSYGYHPQQTLDLVPPIWSRNTNVVTVINDPILGSLNSVIIDPVEERQFFRIGSD